MLKLKDIIKSKQDNTQKFILLNDQNEVLESSFIDKGDGKYILCVPTQTNCAMACRFCFTRDMAGKVKSKNLLSRDMVECVTVPLKHFGDTLHPDHTLLVSFMGNGEPLDNVHEVTDAMFAIEDLYEGRFKVVRFAVATMMPKGHFGKLVALGEAAKNLNVKLHLSLHFTYDGLRRSWMPMAEDIWPSMHMLEWYRDFTGNDVEVHYTPIEGVNDRDDDIARLFTLIQNKGIPIKFLKFSTHPGDANQPSTNVATMVRRLGLAGITTEVYDPPGRDIGSSCGMFLADYYLKYSGKSEQLVTIQS